jgi:hypothetical protein
MCYHVDPWLVSLVRVVALRSQGVGISSQLLDEAQRSLHECLYHLQSVSYRRTLFEALVVSELTLIVAMPPFHMK